MANKEVTNDEKIPPQGTSKMEKPIGTPGARPTNIKKAMQQLIGYCRKYLAIILLALILGMTGAIFNIVGPDFLSQMTDLIGEGLMAEMDLDAIVHLAVILAILYGLGFLFNYVQGFIMATVTQKVTKRLRADISTKINRLPLKYFDKTSYGDILSRVTNDIDLIAQTMNQSLGMLVTSVRCF